MTSQTALNSQQSSPQSAAPQHAGNWKLGAGRAITLHSKDEGVLRIAQGRVWATFDGPHVGPHVSPANDSGDFFLGAGESLTLPAGQRVVIEPWNACANEAAYFSWDTMVSAQQANLLADSRWQLAVVSPLRDFGVALLMAAHALGRLAWGIAGFGEFLVAGRGRVMPRLESNPP